MLDKKTMSELIAIVLHGGADFAEVYAEYSKDNQIRYADKKIETVANKIISGVGIRGFLGERTYFASTTDLTPSGLRACAQRVAQAVGHPVDRIADFSLVERINPNIHPIAVNPFDVSAKVRSDLVRRAADAAWAAGDEIKQVDGALLCSDKSFTLANSEGLYTSDRQIRTRMMVSAVASDGSQNQPGQASPGRQMGLEFFDIDRF
jgi:TldD protein